MQMKSTIWQLFANESIAGHMTVHFYVQRYVQALKDGITYVVQFQVNLDDTFEITYLGASSPKVGEINLWEYDFAYSSRFFRFRHV